MVWFNMEAIPKSDIRVKQTTWIGPKFAAFWRSVLMRSWAPPFQKNQQKSFKPGHFFYAKLFWYLKMFENIRSHVNVDACSMISVYTPSIPEIIWAKNVRAIVVCGLLMKSLKKLILKIWKKSWELFESYLLNSKANPANFHTKLGWIGCAI